MAKPPHEAVENKVHYIVAVGLSVVLLASFGAVLPDVVLAVLLLVLELVFAVLLVLVELLALVLGVLLEPLATVG